MSNKQEIQKLKEEAIESNNQIYRDIKYGNTLKTDEKSHEAFEHILEFEKAQAKLETWKQAITSEIEFLEGLLSRANVLTEDRDYIQEPIAERIEELKGALE